jgi:hypothetical protein
MAREEGWGVCLAPQLKTACRVVIFMLALPCTAGDTIVQSANDLIARALLSPASHAGRCEVAEGLIAPWAPAWLMARYVP